MLVVSVGRIQNFYQHVVHKLQRHPGCGRGNRAPLLTPTQEQETNGGGSRAPFATCHPPPQPTFLDVCIEMLGDRFSSLPTEIIQRIALETVPLSWNYADIRQGRPGPPATLWALHLTSRRLRGSLLFAENPVFYATVFECAFDFDSVRRRYTAWSPRAETRSSTRTGLGSETFGPAAFAWEGRKRWYALHRVRKAANEWDREYARCEYF